MFVCLVGHICTTYMCTQKDERLLYPWNKNCRSCDLLCVILGTEVLSTSEAASFFHHSATLEIIAGVLNHCWKALWCWQDEYSLILLKERVFEQVISTDAASIIALPSFLSSHYMGFFLQHLESTQDSVFGARVWANISIFFQNTFQLWH